MPDAIPNSVRYVKNGRRGQWWPVAKARGQIHVGWSKIPAGMLEEPGDFSDIRAAIIANYGRKGSALQNDLTQLRCVLNHPSGYLWVTFEDSCLWWCTAQDSITVNSESDDVTRGHFWLTCERPWSNRSTKGRLLAKADLPGVVNRVAGFRATVCEPRGWQAILRIVRGEEDPDAARAAVARAVYENAVGKMILKLTWQDFEQLIDLILARTAWTRISILGGSQEGVDIEAQNLAADEIAFVQIKSTASQNLLDEYVSRFLERRDRFARMIFAVHTVQGYLTAPSDLPVQLWTGHHLARLVVQLGLGEWVGYRLG
jgi:restriction endonuclease